MKTAEIGKVLTFAGAMVVGVPIVAVEIATRGFLGVSPTELRNSNILAEKLDRSGIQVKLRRQLTSDQYDSLDLGISQMPVKSQPYAWPLMDKKLGKLRQLPQDSAAKLFDETSSKIRTQKAPDAFLGKLLKKL